MNYHLVFDKGIISKNAGKNFVAVFGFEREMRERVKESQKVKTVNEYNNLVKNIVLSAQKASIKSSKAFRLHEKEIAGIKRKALFTEKTDWGGVALKKVDVEGDFIKKLLVVKQYGVLGFEIHKLKRERLKILEGLCVVLWSNHGKRRWQEGQISMRVAAAGDKFEFMPKDEHGIIALTNCVIEETSTNHLDDLVYIFKAK